MDAKESKPDAEGGKKKADKVAKLALKRLRLGLMARVGQELFDSLSVSAFEDIIGDDFIRGFMARLDVLCVEGDTSDVVTYPESWWEYTKERWFPDWLKSRFPIGYTKLAVTHYHLCPHLNAVPDGVHVEWLRTMADDDEDDDTEDD